MVTTLTLNHADCDTVDSKRVSCLMAAFKRGHVKICKFLVKHVRQFPSDQDCQRYVNGLQQQSAMSAVASHGTAASTVTPSAGSAATASVANSPDKELVKRCQQCMEVIMQAKEKQAQEANRNASLLLKEIDAEKSREQSKKAAAQRKREKRKLKKLKQIKTSETSGVAVASTQSTTVEDAGKTVETSVSDTKSSVAAEQPETESEDDDEDDRDKHENKNVDDNEQNFNKNDIVLSTVDDDQTKSLSCNLNISFY